MTGSRQETRGTVWTQSKQGKGEMKKGRDEEGKEGAQTEEAKQVVRGSDADVGRT